MPAANVTEAPERAARIAAIDVLRGFALLGMIVVHFHSHTHEGADEWLRTAIWRLVEGKSHGTFALLFGAGFALQLARAELAGVPFAAAWLRRLCVLAGFGALAHACFGFNVLLGYAIWGAPLLLLRRLSTRGLLLTALLVLLAAPLFWLGVEVGVWPPPDAAWGDSVDAELVAAEQQPHYLSLLVARLHHMAWFYTRPFFLLPGATTVLFLVGWIAVRQGWFARPRAHERALWAVATFGVAAWTVAIFLPPWCSLLGVLRDQWLAFAWAGGALLLVGRRPALLSVLHPISQAGRMAFTNYMLQIAVVDVLFSGYGVHLPQLRPLVGLLAATALFAGLVALSGWWLRHHAHGPAEWLWRSLARGRMQPWRARAGAGVAPAAGND